VFDIGADMQLRMEVTMKRLLPNLKSFAALLL